MTSKRAIEACIFICVLVTAFAPSMAQAPDCTGISTVYNTDPDLDGELTTVLVVGGLSRPLFVDSPEGDLERLFIVEQDGRIKIVKNGSLLGTDFLDINTLTRSPSDGGGDEQGLLGLAFHPDYENNRQFFVYHTSTSGSTEQLARYEHMPGNPDLADASSRELLLSVPSQFSNHNGGMIAFSPVDGRLYIGTGDGGSACGPSELSQNISSLNGKLLRVDVDESPLGTSGNPYDGPTAGADEVWSFGLRNPYRFSFDRIEGTLYIGDVGQNHWEEVDCQTTSSTGGENYGWDRFEGDVCPPPACGSQGSCTFPDYAPPILTYSLSGAPCAVTGGYVYRGCRMPDLHGTYFYGDYCAASVDSFRTDNTCALDNPQIDRKSDLSPSSGGQVINLITSFGEDASGELYITDRGGEVFRVVPILPILEVSGPNAQSLVVDAAGVWSWEDLSRSTGHDITTYRIYRSSVAPGPFSCVTQVGTNSWPGEPEVPPAGETFHYVVAARSGTQQTTVGAGSDGTLRTATGICF